MAVILYNEIEPYPAQWLRNLCAADLIAPGAETFIRGVMQCL